MLRREKIIFLILISLSVLVVIYLRSPDEYKVILSAVVSLVVAALIMSAAQGEEKTAFFAIVFLSASIVMLFLFRRELSGLIQRFSVTPPQEDRTTVAKEDVSHSSASGGENLPRNGDFSGRLKGWRTFHN